MKEDFFRYLGPPESLAGYTRSYKLVFLTALIDHMDSNGKAPAEAVAGSFLLFYRERIVIPPESSPAQRAQRNRNRGEFCAVFS